MEQAGCSPDVTRLSMRRIAPRNGAGVPRRRDRPLAKAYLRARGHEGGCIAIVGFEGEPDEVERRRLRAAALLRGGGGLRLGRRPGERWLATRYAGPYLRDELLDRGVLVDTLETATSWSNLSALYAAVTGALRDALAQRGTPPLVMCHVSHLYRSGPPSTSASGPQESDAPLEQWRAVRSAASEAISPAPHDHPPPPGGRDHAPGCRPRSVSSGSSWCGQPKRSIRPGSEPGKLLPSES